jgi:hypothetical protein
LVSEFGGSLSCEHGDGQTRGELLSRMFPAEVRVWPGQIHDFQLAAPVVPEARHSLQQVGEYIREATG